MVTIKNVKTLKGDIEDLTLPGKDYVIDAESRLTILPGLIDLHVHFCTSCCGENQKGWETEAKAAIAGGVTTVFDMPSHSPPTVTLDRLKGKRKAIEAQLKEAGIPLRYRLYIGVDLDHIEQIGKVKGLAAAVKVCMGSSKENMLETKSEALRRIFQLAAQENILVALHAAEKDSSTHFKTHDREATIKAIEWALELAEQYKTELFFLQVSTKEEVDLIRQAKAHHLLVFAEATPHHLFFSEEEGGTKARINPLLPTKADQDVLWQAVNDGTIDTIGSAHALYSLEEKPLSDRAPLGISGVQTMLPLMLNAVNTNKLSLEKLVHLTRINPERIFNLPKNHDKVLVDMDRERGSRNEEMKSQSERFPAIGQMLKGWPVWTIVDGEPFHVLPQ